MEYLQLGKQKPKPIPRLKAALEDEFLILDRKKRPPVDDKILKRKIKAEEKKVVRELKKDTIAI